jgi:hypothetical protein
MLQPFRDHLHGFYHVEIKGAVDAQLAATVISEMRHETMPDPEEFMASVTKAKEEGNNYYRRGLNCEALASWQRATDKISRLWNSTLWRNSLEELGTEFVDSVVETFFLVTNERAASSTV